MYINNVKFAKTEQEIIKKINIQELKRISDSDEYQGEVEFHLVGSLNEQNRPTLKLKIYGRIATLCQNCLQSMSIEIANNSTLTVFSTEKQLDAALFGNQDDEVKDGVLAEDEFDVMNLVEDELIMLLPLAPKHEKCIGLSYQDAEENPFKNLKNIT